MKKVKIIPIIVRALGPVSKNVGKYVERTGIELNVEHAQKTALLGTARIFKVSARTMNDMWKQCGSLDGR